MKEYEFAGYDDWKTTDPYDDSEDRRLESIWLREEPRVRLALSDACPALSEKALDSLLEHVMPDICAAWLRFEQAEEEAMIHERYQDYED